MTRWENGPPQCPHCMYKMWQYEEWQEARKSGHCPRCGKDPDVLPPREEMETVCINGRMVQRKKNGQT